MVSESLKNASDPKAPAAGPDLPFKPPAFAPSGAKPSAAFLNPETGQATAVKPDPAGWPKAEVSPGLPDAEAGGEQAGGLVAKAQGQAAGAADMPKAAAAMADLDSPSLPGLELSKPKAPAPGAQPVQLNNPETGEKTKIAPDPAGWPKAEVSPGLPDGLSMDLPGERPKDLSGAPDLPGKDLPGNDLPAGKGPKAPDLGLDAPKADLPGAPKSTRITGLETGDVTTITPDDAGWPEAEVQSGGGPKLPDGLPEGLPEQIAQDQAGQVKPADLLKKLEDRS